MCGCQQNAAKFVVAPAPSPTQLAAGLPPFVQRSIQKQLAAGALTTDRVKDAAERLAREQGLLPPQAPADTSNKPDPVAELCACQKAKARAGVVAWLEQRPVVAGFLFLAGVGVGAVVARTVR